MSAVQGSSVELPCNVTSPLFGDKVRLGLEVEGADYRYRFIDARAVTNGAAITGRLLLMAQVAENDLLRLDLFLKPGLRLMTAPDDPEDFEVPPIHEFQDSRALTIDPGSIVTIKASPRWNFHTGFNMHTAFQIAPEALQERLPATILLAGASFSLKDNWVLYSNNQFGPAAGAAGDTEKFFWSTSIGVRFGLKMSRDQLLVSGF